MPQAYSLAHRLMHVSIHRHIEAVISWLHPHTRTCPLAYTLYPVWYLATVMEAL
jgi:hypothetical protein